jgi:ferredoxin
VPRVRFETLKKEQDVRLGSTILTAATSAGVPLGQSCDGEGICGWCRVSILGGMENLSPPTELEETLRASLGFAPEERAACLARVRGDVTIKATYW